jgi:hypothetical protein
MNCVFIVQAHLSGQQIEQQYLLMIAMLNFDFKVQIIFDEESWHHWQTHKPLQQKINALLLYGAEALLLQNADKSTDSEINQHRLINKTEFNQIMSTAGFVS